jgi:nucleotide-binding universal stress UspA family protein
MYNVRTILVPTDFSAHASAALEHAVFVAAKYNAEITLLHVDEFVVSVLGERGVKAEYLETYRQKKREFFEEQFHLASRIAEAKKVRFRSQVIEGRAYKVIVEESERQAYDLVVIATRGLTHLSTHLIGSTAERVVRLSRQPVLSVPAKPKRGGKVDSILCPTDLSPAGNFALSYAISLAHQNRATLYIQHICGLDKPETESEIRKRLPPLNTFAMHADEIKTEYVVDRDIEPSNSIIRFSDDRHIDLVVMSTHGRKGIRRALIGNNTAEVVRQSTRPVLTVTHPLHKTVFSRPATDAAEDSLRFEEEEPGELM